MPTEVRLKSVEQLIRIFGKKLVDDLGKSLDKKKDASGKLRESIHFRIKIFSTYYQFELLMEDYYKWVDEGRKPGKWPGAYPAINPANILKWMSQKPSLRNKISSLKAYGKNRAAGKISTATNLQKARSLAFLISRKIKKKGIKPTYFFSNVFEDGRVERFKVQLSKELSKDVQVTIKEIAKELK